MITLDENATAVEPMQNRFSYTRHVAGGAPPGQHGEACNGMAAAAAPPGPSRGGGGGGFGGQTMIGGIPRSAIPGLGGSAGGYQAAAIPGLAPAGSTLPGGAPTQPAAAAAAVAQPSARPAARLAAQHQGEPSLQLLRWCQVVAAASASAGAACCWLPLQRQAHPCCRGTQQVALPLATLPSPCASPTTPCVCRP